ncbi:MAG TPA: DUF892 family protein [Geminicoccus sp.]|jgi:ferritin-like metal-binding protein YciE|uniref:YciE/YciF ferroxidase family protein n=1 Tax=Geminicoccus sp. TaxID=2024832 RepID=UPI002E361936|nr:DUF892 family protein [Geminicoccus sp.]HEX2529699.1 DUF892 family protein [Geminicoccus sp.]
MIHTLEQLYLQQLEDLYGAETELSQALPRLLLATAHKDLKSALEKYQEQCLQRRHMLDQILTEIGHEPDHASSAAMQVIIGLGDDMITQTSDPDVRDAGLTAVAQRSLHYQAAAYGSAVPIADILKRKNDRHLLGLALRDSREASELLSKIAIRTMHRAAAASYEGVG